MKKIISLGIASAVLALTAVSASAAVAVRTDDTNITKGSTITVTFTTNEELSSLSFVVDTTGLELVSTTVGTTGMCSYGEATKKFGAVFMAPAAAGTVLMTQTYTVTAEAGSAISVTAKDIDGGNGQVDALTTTVAASGTSSETPSTSSDTSSETPSTSDTSSETPSTSSTPGGNENPPTGVALAVFPAVIAGAAVVVAKKKRG